jgi:hypothetical protein
MDDAYLARAAEILETAEPWRPILDAVEEGVARARVRVSGQALAILEAAQERFRQIAVMRGRHRAAPASLTAEIVALLGRRGATRPGR